MADKDADVAPAGKVVDNGTGPMLALIVPLKPPESNETVAETVWSERTHDTP